MSDTGRFGLRVPDLQIDWFTKYMHRFSRYRVLAERGHTPWPCCVLILICLIKECIASIIFVLWMSYICCISSFWAQVNRNNMNSCLVVPRNIVSLKCLTYIKTVEIWKLGVCESEAICCFRLHHQWAWRNTMIIDITYMISVVTGWDFAHVTLHDNQKHDDVIKWKHFPHYQPFVRGIHRSPVNSPHKGQWRGALMILWPE